MTRTSSSHRNDDDDDDDDDDEEDDDDDVHFMLDQHAKLSLYSAISLNL